MRQTKKQTIMRTALSLFAKKGFYTTTIADIAKELGMSVGNIYNYFSSKDALAKELILYISKILGSKIREINLKSIGAKKKIEEIVEFYFQMAKERPELIDYFLRVYLHIL